MLLLPQASQVLAIQLRDTICSSQTEDCSDMRRTEELTNDTKWTKLKNITRRATSQSQKLHSKELARIGNFTEEESREATKEGGKIEGRAPQLVSVSCSSFWFLYKDSEVRKSWKSKQTTRWQSACLALHAWPQLESPPGPTPKRPVA